LEHRSFAVPTKANLLQLREVAKHRRLFASFLLSERTAFENRAGVLYLMVLLSQLWR